MKRMILFLMAVLLILMNGMQAKYALAQSYQNYYQAVHRAEVLIWQGDYSNALKTYKNAFKTVDYILNKELNNSLTCAAIVEDTNFLFSYLPIFMERGLILDRLETRDPFKKWVGHPQWEKLKTEMSYYKNVYFSSINTVYLRKIDSLNSIDQNVRNRVHPSCFSPYAYKTKRLLRERALVGQVDSSIQKCIWEYIQNYGYLDERISGGKYAQHSPVCYHHFTDSAFVSFQYEMVLQGRLSPEEYASKLLYMSPKDTLLNYWEANTLDKVNRVDARRNLIGLPSYSELQLFIRYMNSERKYPFVFYTTTTTIKKISRRHTFFYANSSECQSENHISVGNLEGWRAYCSLKFQAQRAFEQNDYEAALTHYQQMLQVYGQIVDYADMRNFCVAAARCSDTNSVHQTLLALMKNKCFDIRFLDNPVFSLYKKKNWWAECDSLSHIYGHKNQWYIDTLKQMQIADSAVRYAFTHATDMAVWDSIRAIMAAMDSAHTLQLEQLIKEHGLPTFRNVGYEGFHSAYIIMMHIHSELQDSLIEKLIPLMETGDVPRDKMAYLIDRSLIKKRLPQRYGCQVYRSGKSQPIEDIEHLNERREVMGLWPVDIEKLKTKIVDYD